MPGESGSGQIGNLAAEAHEDEEGRRRHDAPDDPLVHDDADGLRRVVGKAARSVHQEKEAEETQRDGLGPNSTECSWLEFSLETPTTYRVDLDWVCSTILLGQ